jgi:hypothetical protein
MRNTIRKREGACASQRAAAVEMSALASRCDAPQHEGKGARSWSVQISLTAKWSAGPCGTARPSVVWPLDLKLPARRIPSNSNPPHGQRPA